MDSNNYIERRDKMKKNIMSVLFLFFALFLLLAVSSCKEKTPVTVTEQNPQGDTNPAFEPITSPDAGKDTIKLESIEIPGLEITEPEEKVELSGFWMDDLEAAKKKAAEEGKNMLVSFSGTNWCSICVRLDREVFSQEDFRLGASKSFVLVVLDFPYNIELASEELKKAYVEFDHDGKFPIVYL
ncbi:MAG: thioredoxin family protein, partial [Planctomycetes bacterium]|nr:thioredoxin family protein [Planctomycetota bacterium]